MNINRGTTHYFFNIKFIIIHGFILYQKYRNKYGSLHKANIRCVWQLCLEIELLAFYWRWCNICTKLKKVICMSYDAIHFHNKGYEKLCPIVMKMSKISLGHNLKCKSKLSRSDKIKVLKSCPNTCSRSTPP